MVAHRDLVCVHVLQSKVVGLHQIYVIHDLVKKVLAFTLALQKKNKKVQYVELYVCLFSFPALL